MNRFRCNFTHGLYNPLEKHLVAVQMEILDVEFRSSSRHEHFNQNNYHRALGRMIFQCMFSQVNTSYVPYYKAVSREAGCPRNSETYNCINHYLYITCGDVRPYKVRSNSRKLREDTSVAWRNGRLNVKWVDLRRQPACREQRLQSQ